MNKFLVGDKISTDAFTECGDSALVSWHAR